MAKTLQADSPTLVPTGIDGLDDVLHGGLVADRLYLLEGTPGSGKTTLSLQFLLAGVARGESCMFVALSEDKQELLASAASHGWSLDGIHILEIIASEDSLTPDARYTMYHPSEVELSETTKIVLAESAKIKPVRLVFDSLSELRLLAENPLRYRRQILALKQYYTRQKVTVLFVDDRTGEQRDMHLHSLAHGVISLERRVAEYGGMRRQLEICKLRGRSFREGYHDFVIRQGGIQVFPRLVASEHQVTYVRDEVKSGIEGLDSLLGGGLAKGTSTLVLGAAGTGKSSLATQFACAATNRGENATLFLFEEALGTFLERSAGLGMDLAPFMKTGRLRLQRVDPAELSPGEFVHAVREAVGKDKSGLIVIDSLNGYLNAMPNEKFLTLHLRELLTFLGQRGVTTLLLMTQHGLIGADMQVPVDASYLADTVVMLRYFEAFGEIHQAISVIKKRSGVHERTIRELRFANGVTVGDPIRGFHGVLTGVPQLVDGSSDGAKRVDERATRR